ncbi:hypothetical protein [Sediminibacterium salmoneum]|uniref:hypothetical protein n=1 Tax=Sediminibacterium salmoneum TaxID=426421 RepID=UPI0004B855C8|nr:hypothetical protein [Sediminibacterium salmoneum]
MHAILSIFLLIFIWAPVFSQANKDIYVRIKEQDTIQGRRLFIEKPFSKYHDSLFRFLLDKYQPILKYRKGIHQDYLGEFISVHQYGNHYYAYFPSEPFFNTYIAITGDSIIINDFNDGIVSMPIMQLIKTNNTYTIKVSNQAQQEHHFKITKLNGELFSITSSLYNLDQIIFVNRKNFPKYYIIINHSPNNRAPEFHFR